MAQIRYDEKSLLIDGKRIWLVSGAIHYTRTPRELWRDRIRAAKQAGLNAIETYVFWNAHETAPNQFNFEGDLDLRRFIEIIGEEGLYCILRPGPFICAEWDFGGHPAYLHTLGTNSEPMKLREASGPYLQASGRYLAAVMEQVADLQLTRDNDLPRSIVLTQVENEWLTANPQAGTELFEALARDLRANGCETPFIACNNLWFQPDGMINTWNESQNLPASLRQLARVQPNAPRLITEYWTGWFDHWGAERLMSVSADLHEYRLAGILANGGQPNLFMFHGGTNFGFTGGRTVGDEPTYMTTSYDYDAPLSEAGQRTEKYFSTKRVSHFANQFAHVFANLDPEQQPTAIALDEKQHPPSVIQQSGTQGHVVFIFKSKKDKSTKLDLLLPNGLKLPVPTTDQRVSWLLLDTNLTGRGTLDLTNLCPWAWVDQKMLVLFGPAGADGFVSIDGSLVQCKVPTGKTPHIEQREEITLCILNHEQVDSAYVLPDSVILGTAGLDENDNPLPLKGHANALRIHTTGHVEKIKTGSKPRKTSAPRFANWQWAQCPELTDPENAGFIDIDGPASLEQLGINFGYGWYRLRHLPPANKLKKLLLPSSCGDRLHFYQNGKFKAGFGLGPGFSQDNFELESKQDAIVLADNLGRFNFGQHMLEDTKGLADHIYGVKQARIGKPTLERKPWPDVSDIAKMVMHLRVDAHPTADALTWQVRLVVKTPVIMEIPPLGSQAVLLGNGTPFKLLSGDGSRGLVRIVLHPKSKPFDSGQNELTLQLKDPDVKAADFADKIRFYHIDPVSEGKPKWSYKPFDLPGDDAFGKQPARTPAQPCFYRSSFSVNSTASPLFLHIEGMSKGQIYLNGHNVGRYFVGTPHGGKVPPQDHYYLPEPWLNTDDPNVLTLFDEHGKMPTKVKLVYR